MSERTLTDRIYLLLKDNPAGLDQREIASALGYTGKINGTLGTMRFRGYIVVVGHRRGDWSRNVQVYGPGPQSPIGRSGPAPGTVSPRCAVPDPPPPGDPEKRFAHRMNGARYEDDPRSPPVNWGLAVNWLKRNHPVERGRAA